MPFRYINRKNLVYYLCVKKDEQGNPQYYFTRTMQKNDLETVPEGYEVFEDQGGKVHLKKIQQ